LKATDFVRMDDESLLVAVDRRRAGPSFGVFYERHERLIAAYHLRRVRDPELAADLTSETFAQALASRDRFTPRGPGSAARWLYMIAHNVRSEAERKATAERRKSHELGIVRRQLSQEQREELAVLATEDGAMRALEELPAPQRSAIKAYVLDDIGYPEIAAHEGVDETTIRKRVSRGLAQLRGGGRDKP
jgi:RNA polymerase sigma-70 factor (ECF subfamily)